MSRVVRLILVLALATSGLVAFQPPASAAPCVRIHRIYYNSPGKDDRSNKSLNAEWIQLKNYCRGARWLTSWTIRDVARHVYTFGTFKLGGGKYVRLHTGGGTDSARHLYWGRRAYVWNNDKDTAFLRNARGKRVDKCSYNNRSASSVYC